MFGVVATHHSAFLHSAIALHGLPISSVISLPNCFFSRSKSRLKPLSVASLTSCGTAQKPVVRLFKFSRNLCIFQWLKPLERFSLGLMVAIPIA